MSVDPLIEHRHVPFPVNLGNNIRPCRPKLLQGPETMSLELFLMAGNTEKSMGAKSGE